MARRTKDQTGVLPRMTYDYMRTTLSTMVRGALAPHQVGMSFSDFERAFIPEAHRKPLTTARAICGPQDRNPILTNITLDPLGEIAVHIALDDDVPYYLPGYLPDAYSEPIKFVDGSKEVRRKLVADLSAYMAILIQWRLADAVIDWLNDVMRTPKNMVYMMPALKHLLPEGYLTTANLHEVTKTTYMPAMDPARRKMIQDAELLITMGVLDKGDEVYPHHDVEFLVKSYPGFTSPANDWVSSRMY